MDVYVVFGHDGNGAWIIGVYKDYKEAQKVQARERSYKTFDNDIISIASRKLE